MRVKVLSILRCFVVSLRENAENCGTIGHEAQDCENKTQQNGGNYGN
jgi:hypothetical protein